MGRIIGLDVGRRRVGVSVSDPTGVIARGIKVIDRKKEDLMEALKNLVDRYKAEKIVIGMPMDTRGGMSKFGIEVQRLGEEIEKKLSVKVVFWNEAYTTQEAFRYSRKKEDLDLIASEIILQSYLDYESS